MVFNCTPGCYALRDVVTHSEVWSSSLSKIRYIYIWTFLHQLKGWYIFIKIMWDITKAAPWTSHTWKISTFLRKSIKIIPMYHKCCGTHNWQIAKILKIWSHWHQLHFQLNISWLIRSETQLHELMGLYHIQY